MSMTYLTVVKNFIDMIYIWKKILYFLSKGDSRTVKAKKNIIYSFFLKGVDGVVYLLLVPITLGFLDKYSYGIWLTLNSILMWINTFDIGLGNGMRNRLTKAIAMDDYNMAKIYISTTYFLLFLIICTLFPIAYIANTYINWHYVLGVDSALIPNLNDVVLYSFLFFCVSFVLKLIGNVYMALQLPAVNNLLVVSGHLLSLIIIVILRYSVDGNLMYVAIAYSASPCLVYLLVTPFTFIFLRKELAPSLKLVNLKYGRDLVQVGVSFFVLQIGALVIFSMSNVLVSNLLGPDRVAPYNIANRYLSMGLIVLNIVLSPIWSAVTDAYAKKDFEWIENSLNRIRQFTVLWGGGILFLVLISKYVYSIWLGDAITIPFSMTLLQGVYVILYAWSVGQSCFLNGMNVLRLQLVTILIEALIFIPLAIFMIKLFGLNGIVVALILANLPAAIINTVQVSKIVKNKATGIWLK